MGGIEIYKSKSGPILDVHLDKETVWLSQKQMGNLFDKDIRTVNEHIRNIFAENELKEKSVIRKFRITASDGKSYLTNFYNLDVIISVGYRIKSLQGTLFRIWATNVLRKYLINGYAINKKKLIQTQNNLNDLQETILFLKEKTGNELLAGQEKEILNILANYSKTLTFLGEYDKNEIKLIGKTKGKFVLTYEKSRNLIDRIKSDLLKRKEASEMFAQESGEKFKAILGNIYQTFGKAELYFSIEEKAAHLLYFVIKDHPFVDGNKRSAAMLFIYFLDKNNCLYRGTGERKINDNALAALALLIAVSDPQEKDKLVKMTTNLLAF